MALCQSPVCVEGGGSNSTGIMDVISLHFFRFSQILQLVTSLSFIVPRRKCYPTSVAVSKLHVTRGWCQAVQVSPNHKEQIACSLLCSAFQEKNYFAYCIRSPKIKCQVWAPRQLNRLWFLKRYIWAKLIKQSLKQQWQWCADKSISTTDGCGKSDVRFEKSSFEKNRWSF